MKAKPKRPVRRIKKYKWYLDDGGSLASVIEHFSDLGFSPEDVKVDVRYSEYGEYESGENCFCAEGPESEEEFGARLLKFDQRMQAYHNWYEENKQLIEEELERRRLMAEEKKRKDKEKARKRLEKARKRAARELAKIEAQLKTS